MHLGKLEIDIRVTSHRAGEDVALLVPAGLFRGERPIAHLLGHPAVVGRESMDPSAADEVGAAVADVGYRCRGTANHCRHYGGPHVLIFRFLGKAVHFGVGRLERAAEGGGDVVDRVGIVVAQSDPRGKIAGRLAGLVAAHAIGDQVQVALAGQYVGRQIGRGHAQAIFILLAAHTAIADGADLDGG